MRYKRYNIFISYNDTESGISLDWTQYNIDKLEPFSFSVDSDQYFKRISWGEVTISNNSKDGEFLYDLINSVTYTTEIRIRLTTTNNQILGYFGKNDCKFDYDRKILKVTPTILDKYTTFLENWESEIDFNLYPFEINPINAVLPQKTLSTISDWSFTDNSVVGSSNLISSWRFTDDLENTSSGWAYFFNFVTNIGSPNRIGFNDANNVGMVGQYPDPNSSNSIKEYLANRETILGEDDYLLTEFTIYESNNYYKDYQLNRKVYIYCTTHFSREELIKIDVIDSGSESGFESPDGSGWNIREATSFNGKPAHLWTRKPYNKTAEDLNSLWVIDDNKTAYYNSVYKIINKWSSHVDFSLEQRNINTPISFRDLLTYFYQNTSIDKANSSVKSTLFFNDNEASMPLISDNTGLNYVTLGYNYLNNIMAFFTNDIKDVEEGNSNTITKYSIKQILDDLYAMSNGTIYWDIDYNGGLVLEHVLYLDVMTTPFDIRSITLPILNKTWSFDKAKMYNRIEISSINSDGYDFTNNIIEFNKIVSNNRTKDVKLTRKTSVLSTDLEYALSNTGNLSDGIVLVDVENDTVVSETTPILKEVKLNGRLALSKLLNDFGTYNGVWKTGRINNVSKEFKSTMKTKLAGEIVIKGIYDYLFYQTAIGIGILDSGTLDFDNELTKLNLKYKYDAETTSDTFELMVQKNTDFVGAENIRLDLGSYSVEQPHTFNVEPISDKFSQLGATKSFIITTPLSNSWSATLDSGWFTFVGDSSGNGNGIITISVPENLQEVTRTATLKITHLFGSVDVLLYQLPHISDSTFTVTSVVINPTTSGVPQGVEIYIKNIGSEDATKPVILSTYDSTLTLLSSYTVSKQILAGQIIHFTYLIPDSDLFSGEYTFTVTVDGITTTKKFNI